MRPKILKDLNCSNNDTNCKIYKISNIYITQIGGFYSPFCGKIPQISTGKFASAEEMCYIMHVPSLVEVVSIPTILLKIKDAGDGTFF